VNKLERGVHRIELSRREGEGREKGKVSLRRGRDEEWRGVRRTRF